MGIKKTLKTDQIISEGVMVVFVAGFLTSYFAQKACAGGYGTVVY